MRGEARGRLQKRLSAAAKRKVGGPCVKKDTHRGRPARESRRMIDSISPPFPTRVQGTRVELCMLLDLHEVDVYLHAILSQLSRNTRVKIGVGRRR